MKMELRIFFSWQTSSKTDKLNNKEFILECIQKAVIAIENKGTLKGITFRVQQGTGGEPGTPDMIATCLRRNDECHIFIADISVDKHFNKVQRWANRKPELRERPNENVMYELGRADGHLDYGQVIQVANTVFGDVSENDYLRPIDIRHKRRPITFHLEANDGPKAEKVRRELTENLKTALKKSAKAALEHIHKELLPYERCEDAIKEMQFEGKFIFKGNLKDMEKAISDNKGLLRVLGLNGVGKTRLVMETVLKETEETPKLYCDCLLAAEQYVIDTTTRIYEKYGNTILILDNCNEGLFAKLKTLYGRKNAQNRLYAISDETVAPSNGCEYVLFNDAYEEVVDGIIAKFYGQNDEVSARIKDNACGNPLFAVQAIKGLKETGDLRDFDDRKLMANMLSAAEGSEERVIAETISLFSNIGYDGDAHKEIEAIAKNKNITGLNGDDTVLVNKFDTLIKKYLDRGLMQRVGVFVRFRSPAISKMLAMEWFDKCTAQQLEQVIITLGQVGMAVNLVPPFFEKVRDMDNNSRVIDLLKELLQPNRLLTFRDFINTEVGSKIYRSLIEVVPEAVADSLYTSLGGLSIDELKEIRDGRRELVWTLEKLCYKPETFQKAAKLLLRLSCAENEFISNNATGEFVALFPVRLPSTSVPLAKRLAFLQREIKSQEEKPVVMKALGRALSTANFIHFGGKQKVGTQVYGYYEPQSDQEIDDYINGCLDLLQQEIDGNTEYKDESIGMLVSNFRSLNAFGSFDAVMPRVEKVAASLNYDWDDMLKVLHFARRDPEKLRTAQNKQRIEALIQKLTKTDFVSRFAAVESFEKNDYLGMADFERQKIVDGKYEALADDLVNQKLYSKELLKDIYDSQTFLAYAFPMKLVALSTPEEQLQFASDSIDLMEGRTSSIFVYYVKDVTEEVFAQIVSIIEAKEKEWLLFSLVAIRNYGFTHPYVDKLFELVAQKKVEAGGFVSYWSYVRIDRQSTPEGVDLLARVMQLPDGFEIGLHMAMSQYLSSQHNNDKMDALMESEIAKRADKVSELITNPQYSHILGALLTKGKRDGLAGAMAKGVFSYIVNSDSTTLRYEVETVLQRLFENYFDITWREMAGLMSTEDDADNFVKFYFAFGFSSLHNPFPGLIFKKENMPVLMDWCKNHPDVAPYRLMALAPLIDGDGLSEPVMALLDNYGSQKMVRTALSDKLGTFAGPASTYNDRASLIEPLTKHNNPDVNNWATLEIEHLKYYGRQTQKMEENFLLPGRLPSHQWALNPEGD